MSPLFQPTGNIYRLFKFYLRTLISRFMAVAVAARTSPSSSAPLKFLVLAASSFMSTSFANLSFSRNRVVWMFRIWVRPNSSGRSGRETLKLVSMIMSKFNRLQLRPFAAIYKSWQHSIIVSNQIQESEMLFKSDEKSGKAGRTFPDFDF